MTNRLPLDRALRLGPSLPFDRRVLGGAAAVLVAVLAVHYALPQFLRTDAVQMSLTGLAVFAVGFVVGDGSDYLRIGAFACGLGGAFCVLVVVFEASRRGLGYELIVAASAVVLPVLFATLGAMGASTRLIVAKLGR